MNEEVKIVEKTVKKKGLWRKFFRLVRLARVPWLGIVLYFIVSTGSIYLALALPQVQGDFFAGDASVKNVVTVIVIEFLSSFLISVMLLANGVIGGRIDRNFRNAIWDKILHLEPKYFDQISPNTLLSRITDDAESLKTFIMQIFVTEITGLATTIATVAAMATMDIKLVYIMAVFIPLVILGGFLVGRLKLKFGNKMKYKMASLTDYLSGQLARLTVIKAFNRQEYETKRGEAVIEEYYIAERKTKIATFIQYTVRSILGLGPEMAIIIIGIGLLENKVLTVAAWVAFRSYASNLVLFFQGKSDTWLSLKEIQGFLIRLSDLFDLPNEGVNTYIQDFVESGDIVFEDVSFAYGEKKILSNASMTFPKHAFTAIVGPSGTGKTTILKLLERIYDPDEGRILLNGLELKDYKIEEWRRNIAYVKQDTPLISGTIRDNILYGVEAEVSDEQIMEAAEQVRADAFIKECPNGLDEEVGQFGSKLSGGQRQKISIIRAFLQNREYILLDEPTASLDVVSAYDVMQSIEQLKQHRTIILVAHDDNLVKKADHIIVLDENQQVMEGSVEQMRKENAYFAQMLDEMERGEIHE